jgi:hypothetical protein
MFSTQPGTPVLVGKGADDWFTPWRFAALLGLLIVACFPQVVAGLQTFVYLDAGQFAYPVAFYHRESFWRGEIPLWNPFNSGGIPFLAQWNTLTLYPLSLFYCLFPLPWSFGVFCLLHLFLAGLGMYFLAHRWTGNRLAAAVAGAIFSFNGLTWYGLMWPHIIAALAWMPWVVLTVERAWREGGRSIIVATVASAMQLFSAGAEVIFQTWLLLGAIWVLEVLRGETPRWKMIMRTLGVGCLAIGLAAAQLLPFLDLLAHSQRDPNYGNLNYGHAEAGVMPFTGWANYLVPAFHCSRNPQGMLIQAGLTWLGSWYLGVGAVILALLAVWRGRNQRVWLLTALAIFSLLMALGSRGLVYEWFKCLFPLIGFIRFPIKFLMLATFVIPLLAAYGLSWFHGLPTKSWPREWRRIKGLALGLIGLMTVILWLAWKYPQQGGELTTTAWNALVRALFLLLLVGGIALLRRDPDLKRQRLWQTGFIVLLWFDVFTNASNLNPTVKCSIYEPDLIRRFFKWDDQLEAGVSRAMQSKASYKQIFLTELTDPVLDAYRRRLTLSQDFNLLDHVPTFEGHYSLDLKESLAVFRTMYLTTNECSRLKDFLGISHTSNPTNTAEWVSRESFLPMITTGQKPEFVSDAETLNALVSDNFEPLRTVYLPLEACCHVRANDQAKARIVSSQFSTHRLEIEVEADAPAMVVVAQAFYHPWHAYVDGEPTRLWRANYAYQALEVPPGEHRVRLVYEDKMFLGGVLLTLTAMLACGTAWAWWRKPPV